MPLTARLLSLVALAVLPAVGIGAYNEYSLRQSRGVEVKADAVAVADQSTREMRQIVESIQRVAATLAQIPLIQEAVIGAASPQACSDLLGRLRREYPGQIDVGVADRGGHIICTSRGVTNYGQVQGSHVRRAIETGSFVIGGYGAGGSEQFLSFAYPLRNPGGEIVGAIVPGLSLRWLDEHMRQRFAGRDACPGDIRPQHRLSAPSA
jgi:hypothetical protein